ncbi:MAG TPA: hypothetical protein VGJ21_25800 [Terracidiphilus sp.]|jgi:hypothetical protein
MRPQTVGRVLGVGLRIAGRMAGQRLSGNGAARPVTVAGVGGPGTNRAPVRQATQAARAVRGGVSKGIGGLLKPFRRVGGILFLEVTGVLFFLFVLVFGTWAWKMRASYAAGPDHAKFLAYAAMTLLFLYLSMSSFWRTRKK